MSLTQQKNIADATDPQDATPLHQVQSIAATAAAGAGITSLAGDVTGTGPGATATTIAANAVSNTKLADMPTATLKGRSAAGTGDPSDLTAAAVKTLLAISFADVSGTLAAGQFPALTGDVTTPGGSLATTIANDAVAFAKMQNIPTQTLVGRQTAATGDPESIGVAGGIEFDGSGNLRVGAFTGDVSKSAGSAGTVINPGVVTNTQLAVVPTGTVKGRTAAGTGAPSDITFAALKTAIAISFLDITGTLQAAQFPALTGDVTTTAGSFSTTLVATGVAAGTFGDGSHSLTIQVDAKGRVLAISAPSISITAGAVAGLSTTQTGALTGDVTKPAGSGTTTLVNIPNDVTVPGDLLATAIADPAVPAAGTARVYLRSTGKVWASRDENGNVSHTVRTKAAASHQFLTAIGDDGTVSAAQPSYDDLAAGTAQPWATFQFVWSQGTVSFPSPQDRWLSTYLPADGSTTDRRFPFYGAGKASTVQSLQVCLNLSITSGTTALVTFTLQVNGTDTGLSFIVPLAGSPGSSTPVVFGASTGLTIPDGSMVGIRMSESVIGGPIGGAAYNAHVTLILR